jgi:hypothetical protein
MADPTPIEQIDDALIALRARIATSPPEKTSLEQSYQQLIAKRDEYVEKQINEDLKEVGAAASDLEKVVRSASTDPIETYSKNLAKVQAKLQKAIERPTTVTGAGAAVGGQRVANSKVNGAAMALPLTQGGLEAACQQVGVKAAEIWAIVYTETDPPYCGFLGDGRPQILYERHIFHRLTGGKFSADNPSVSNPNPGGYGASGANQFQRLKAAIALDETAALQSASWGIGQTLGTNYKKVGFGTPQEFVRQMFYSEDQQLLAAVREVSASGIASALAAHDWKAFASVYNGPSYWKNNYDEHLKSWYEKLSTGALPDLRIRAAQIYLMYLGYDPSTIDGVWGKRTQSAWNLLQAKKGIPTTDELDDRTWTLLLNDAQKANAELVVTV